jgi:teichuronic acid biosynthesis glycosyltransferase TuaG
MIKGNGWKVSFVIPTYNCAAFLPHAVESCLNQTYKDIEIVIVNDASTDTTKDYLDWLAKKGDERIVIHTNEKNNGRSESRNIGNKLATGRIIFVLDADDLAVANRAELTVMALKDQKHDVLYGSAILMDALGNQMGEVISKPLDKDTIKETKSFGIVHSTLAYTKKIADKYAYRGGEIADLGLDDWDLYTRMFTDGVKFNCIPDVLAAWRDVSDSVSHVRDNKKVLELKEKIMGGPCKI